MTAAAYLSSARFAVAEVFSLEGLSLWSKLVLAFLKLIAVAGYHVGKCTAACSTECSPALPQAGEDQEQTPAVEVAEQSFRLPGEVPAHVAVVIPVYSSSQRDIEQLSRTLQGLQQQERLADMVAVVDDAGPVPVPASICSQRVTLLVRLSANRGPAQARNVGMAAARRLGARLVAFLDADCVPHPKWLAAMVAAQEAAPGITCGRTVAAPPATAVGLFHDVCGTLNGRFLKDGSLLYGCTCNLAIDTTRVPLEFDASFPRAAFEDVELCVRARKVGAQLTYTPDAIVQHQYDTTWAGLFRQFQRYGRFEQYMCSKHREYLPWLYSSSTISCYGPYGVR